MRKPDGSLTKSVARRFAAAMSLGKAFQVASTVQR